jgi:MFS family permease
MIKEKFSLSWLQAILTFVNSGFVVVLLYHFYKINVGLADIFFADAIACGLNALILLFRKNIKTHRDMRIGFGILALSLIAVAFVPYSKPLFYIFYILQVLGGIAFYVPLNILYFANPIAGDRMKNMAWYWIIGIITGITGPLLGAFLFLNLSLKYFLIVPILLFLFGIYATRFAENTTVSYTPLDVLKKIKRVRLINMLDGALHRVNGDTGLFVLMFVGSLAQFSIYLSVTALLMAAVAWIVAHNSDKTNRRMVYLLPAALIAGLGTMSFSFAHSLLAFGIITIIIRSSLIIAEPLRSNIMVDAIDAHAHNWISREFYLNIGRSLVQLSVGILFVYGFITQAFVFFGLLHFAFPLLVHYKKIYRTL